MFKKLWDIIKKPFVWINEKVKKIAPGLKTKTVAFLGIIGSTAGILQEYISGLPLGAFISATHIAIISAILFSLSFWFRALADSK